VFGPFKHNVLGNPALAAISQCYQNAVVRLDERTGLPCGNYKAITADADFQHGGSPHGIIFDEMHVQPNRDLWDVLQTGKIKRTAAAHCGRSRPPASTATRFATSAPMGGAGTRRGHKRSIFPRCIYAAEPADDWTSPETWRKANPNLGVSIREEDIAKECEKAKGDSRLRKHVQAIAPLNLDRARRSLAIARIVAQGQRRITRPIRRAVLVRPGPFDHYRPVRFRNGVSARGRRLLSARQVLGTARAGATTCQT
jgi:phage terminase large subunit-like protein